MVSFSICDDVVHSEVAIRGMSFRVSDCIIQGQ